MAFQGNLSDIALPDILQLLAAQGKSGVLTLCRGDEKVRIGIVDGSAVDAESNHRPLARRLGAVLVQTGNLAPSDLARALAMHQETGRRLGEILVTGGWASRENVRRALSLQFRQTVYDVLCWDDGSYDFERCDVDYDRDNLEPVGVQGILMDGFRIIDEWPMLEKRLAHRATVLHRVPRPSTAATAEPSTGEASGFLDLSDPPDEACPSGEDRPPELSDLEAEIYQRVDGSSTIQQIIDASLHLEFDVCRALYDLWEQNLIAPAYEGRLEDVDFADLVLAIRRTRSTGELELRRGDVVRRVLFHQGDFLSAVSSDPDDGTGPYLLRAGAITRRDLSAAVAGALGDTAILEHLLRTSLPEPGLYERHLCEQVEELIVASFAWTEGSYRYRPGPPPQAPAVSCERRTPAIVLKGIRSVDRWSRIERAVGPPDALHVWGEVGLSEAWDHLPDEHQRFLERFSDGLRVEEIAAVAEVPEVLGYQLLWWGKTLALLEGGNLSQAVLTMIAALSGEPPAADTAAGGDDAGSLDPLDLAPDLELTGAGSAAGHSSNRVPPVQVPPVLRRRAKPDPTPVGG